MLYEIESKFKKKKKKWQKIYPVKFRLKGFYKNGNEAWGSHTESSSRRTVRVQWSFSKLSKHLCILSSFICTPSGIWTWGCLFPLDTKFKQMFPLLHHYWGFLWFLSPGFPCIWEFTVYVCCVYLCISDIDCTSTNF